MDNIREPIKKMEILSINIKEKNQIVVRAITNNDLIEFEFRMTYRPELKVTQIERSQNFINLARYNSAFEKAVHDLVKKVYDGERLDFPIKINFE